MTELTFKPKSSKPRATRRLLAKAAARAKRNPVEFTNDPRDLTRAYQCACGQQVPRPSYSVKKGVWVTSRHGVKHVVLMPIRSKSGVEHLTPVTMFQMCDALSEDKGPLELEAPEQP